MKLSFASIKSAADNIARYIEKEASVAERMSANLSELAGFVATAAAKNVKSKSFFTDDMPLEMYMPSMPDIDEVSDGALVENASLVKGKLNADKGAYVADFCAKVTSKLKTVAKLKPSPALFTDFDGEKRLDGTVAFAESQVLIAAFLQFQKKNSRLSPSYVRSFTDACEDVSAGVCDFCILPIENSRDGALLTVYGLIERYELFIARVVSVESNDITTKFALLCRGFRGIIETNNIQNIDLRLSARDLDVWAQIYTGASVLGIGFIKNVAVPLMYTDGYAHICTFSASGETLFAFLLFLSTIRADYTIIGVYEE
ncbi:MAG: hypothetical protein E7598_06735 [Ruminococcaceae bacterium]|nr:hypothetical protein [Oscillospiraceae bacterium]